MIAFILCGVVVLLTLADFVQKVCRMDPPNVFKGPVRGMDLHDCPGFPDLGPVSGFECRERRQWARVCGGCVMKNGM